MTKIAYCVLALLWCTGAGVAETRTPADIYGPLFEAVQKSTIFPDSKTFVDAVAKGEPASILQDYAVASKKPEFSLKAFVEEHFELPSDEAGNYRSSGDQSVCRHIDDLWSVLQRKPVAEKPGSSLLPLRYSYVVPGGRFREIYYWDSFFTMQGLQLAGRVDLMGDLVDNLADLAQRYGHVPNGNRNYYLSRSQPPFLAAMVDTLVQVKGSAEYRKYLPALKKEYAFWMDGADHIGAGEVYRRVVRMGDGSLLNRYWDDRDTPREESYREDVATAQLAAESGRKPEDVYRNLRAGAESGWDFSSRWLKDPMRLDTVRTTEIVPVDLNSLLYNLEQTLEKAYRFEGDIEQAKRMHDAAARRKMAIDAYLWNSEKGYFVDYIRTENRLSNQLTAATVYPLYFGLASQDQADSVARVIQRDLLKLYGLVTTTLTTGQQWDAPNSWAPLQWLAVRGLEKYDHQILANDIATRWLKVVADLYRKSSKLDEKYNAFENSGPGVGGEYQTQDGFGWTNGVVRSFLASSPVVSGPDCKAKTQP